MDARRIIPIEVKDEYIIGAGRVIGAKGSHDDVVLRAAFNDMWDGTSKTAVWLNAIGEQAVVQMLLPDTKENGAYLIPIPEEAKSEVGDVMLTIKGFTTADGATEGSATITATAYFRVLEGDFDQGASDSGSITLNQSEQFQAQLTAIEADIINAAKAADAKEAAEESANAAKAASAAADIAAQRAEDRAKSAANDASTALAGARRAETAAGRAETAAKSASDSAGRAQQDLKTIEEDLLPQTEGFSNQAKGYRDEADAAKTAAQTASANASRSATAANASAGDAAREAARAKSNNEDIADMIDGFGDTVEAGKAEVNEVLQNIDEHVETAHSYAESAWEAAEAAEAAADRAENASGSGGDVSKAYVDAELAKKFNKTGGLIDGDVVIGDGSLVEDANGNVEERKVILHYGKTMLGFANSTLEDVTGIVDYEYGGGKIKGLEDAEADNEAVPYGQMKAELEKLSIESSGIATKKGTIVEINSNYDAPIRSVGSVDGSTINTVTVWGKNHFHRDHSASVTANGVTATWDPKNQEFIFNGTTLAPGDMRLVNPMPLDWIVGEKYTISIRHVSGTADLGSGTGITYAWGVFLNDASSLLRGNTNNAEFVDLYSFTGTAFALPSNKTYILYFQCWRAGTVFNNYRVKIQIEKGTSVTEWEAYRGETASTSSASNLMLHKGKNFVKATPSAEISVGYTVNIGEYVNDMFSKLEERIAALEEQLNAMA